jgi:hypothetical protein
LGPALDFIVQGAGEEVNKRRLEFNGLAAPEGSATMKKNGAC